MQALRPGPLPNHVFRGVTLGTRILSSEVFWSGLAILLMVIGGLLITAGVLTFSPVVVGALGVAVMGAGLIMYSPYLGILLFLSILYLRPEQFLPQLEGLRLPLTLSSATLLGYGLHLALKREKFLGTPHLAWMVGFAMLMILSAVNSTEKGGLITAVMDALRITFMFLLIQQLLGTPDRARKGLDLVLAAMVGLGLSALRAYATDNVLVEHGMKRAIVPVGDFDDPNDLAAALVVGAPLALMALLSTGSWLRRLWGGAALGVLALAIFLTNSRGGMLALGVGCGVFVIHRLGWGRGALLGLVLLGLFAAFAPDRFSADSVHGDDSSIGRILAWEAGFQMLARNPLLGVGYNMFEAYHVIPAHNSLVHGFAEGGLLLATAWVGLQYWGVLTATRLARSKEPDPPGLPLREYGAALQAGLLASLTAQFFLSHTFRPIPMVPLALIAALAAVAGPRDWKKDGFHFAAVPAVTLAGILVVWLAVTVAP